LNTKRHRITESATQIEVRRRSSLGLQQQWISNRVPFTVAIHATTPFREVPQGSTDQGLVFQKGNGTAIKKLAVGRAWFMTGITTIDALHRLHAIFLSIQAQVLVRTPHSQNTLGSC